MIPGTLGYGWTSTGEQPSVMSDGGQAEGEALESLDGRRREQRDPSRLSPGIPGETSRALVLRDSRFRIVPSARWQRSAASRTVYQRSTSPNTGSIMLRASATPVPEAEVNERGDLGRPTHATLANSFKEFAEGGSSVTTSNSAITAPRLLSRATWGP